MYSTYVYGLLFLRCLKKNVQEKLEKHIKNGSSIMGGWRNRRVGSVHMTEELANGRREIPDYVTNWIWPAWLRKAASFRDAD